MKKVYTLTQIIALLLFCSRLSAGTTISSANGGGFWNSTFAWSPAQIPVAGDSVVITSGNPITISVTANAKSVNIQAGAILVKNSNLTVTGVFRHDGTMSGAGTLFLNGANVQISGSSTINYNGVMDFNGTCTVLAGTVMNKQNNFVLHAGANVTNNGSMTSVNGNLQLPAGATFTNGANALISTVTNWTVGGTLNCSAVGNTASFGASCTSIPTASPSYYHLTLAGGTTKTLTSNTLVNGNFTISAGGYNGNGFNMTLVGNWTDNNAAANTSNANIIFTGAATQTITKSAAQENFSNITMSGTGTVSLNVGIYVSGNITINSGTFDCGAGSKTVNLSGSWNNTGGTYNPRSGFVIFLPFSPQTVTKAAGVESFYTFQISNGATSTLTLNSDISVAGNLNIVIGTFNASSHLISLKGNWSHTGGTFTPGTSMVNFHGAATQTVTCTAGTETFYNFNKDLSNTVTLAANIACNNNLAIQAGTVDASASNFNISVKGNLSLALNAVLNNHSNTVTLNGAAAQTVSNTTATATTFFNLTLNNAAGASITSGTYSITNMLTATAGMLNNTGATITLISTAAKIAVIGSGAGSFGGNYIMQRYIPARSANWHDFSSQVTSTTLADWNQSTVHEIYMSGVGGPDGNACCPTFYSVHTYNEATGAYVNVVTNATVLGVGTGYQIYLGDNLLTWNATSLPDTRGTPNSGTVNKSLAFSASPDPGANLVGNPFHSHITWNACNFTNVDPTIYMMNNSGNYLSFSGAVDIPPLQGFFAYATAGGANIGFTQAAKTASTGNNFNRMADPANISLKLSSPVTDYWHEIAINFSEQASNGYDPGYDAYFIKSPETKAPNLSMVMERISRPLIKNTINPNLTDDIMMIPIKARVGVSGTYTIEASGIANVTEYACVLLQDLTKKKMIDLRKQSAYSFDINEGDNPDRFMLYLVKKNSDCDNLTAKTQPEFFNDNQVQIMNTDQGAYVHFDLDAITPVTIGIYDMLGNQVSQTSLEAFLENEKLELPVATGLYMVRVTVGDHVISGKIFAGPQQ